MSRPSSWTAAEVSGIGLLEGTEGWVGQLEDAALLNTSAQVLTTPEELPAIAWLVSRTEDENVMGVEFRSFALRDGRVAWVATGGTITVGPCADGAEGD